MSTVSLELTNGILWFKIFINPEDDWSILFNSSLFTNALMLSHVFITLANKNVSAATYVCASAVIYADK